MHPFSIAHYDPESHELDLIVKDLGPFSHLIQNLQIGDKLWLDGPYGVFTREVPTTKQDIVFLAGGIGIVPFVPNMAKVSELSKRMWLFYANREPADIIVKQKLEEFDQVHENFQLINVVEHEPEHLMEQGFITADLLRKHLGDDLTKYEYFICGPPPMLKAMLNHLNRTAVPSRQVHFEKFSA
jgi:predicted ferric reductase